MAWKMVENEGVVRSNLFERICWLSKMVQTALGLERSCEMCGCQRVVLD